MPKYLFILRFLFVIGVFVSMFAIAYVMANNPFANANPSGLSLCSTDTSNEATTTLNFMTPGRATTTLLCGTDGADQFDLYVLYKTSSTASKLHWRYEFSHNNKDWYIGETDIFPTATTSPLNLANAFTEYALQYASSTLEASGGNADAIFKRVQLKNLGAKYVRVKFYVPIGALNGAVYAEIVKKSQS